MGRLREFRRKLDEIQRRQLRGPEKVSVAGPPAATSPPPIAAPPSPGAHRSGRWNPFLDSLLRRVSGGAAPAPRGPPVTLEGACPGTVVEVRGVGRAYVMEESDDEWLEAASALRDAVSLPGSALRARLLRGAGIGEARPEDLLFVDIETTGLGSTPLFLIGTMALEQDRLLIRQYLARDYAEEQAVLTLFVDELGSRRILVSFNGKSFDLPYVRVRLAYHRAASPAELPHFDVLLEARRVWRGQVPDCRLKTLEQLICGRRREGDIDGADIPEAYHRFVRTGDAAEIAAVVRHNRLDLLTMADLALRMPPADS